MESRVFLLVAVAVLSLVRRSVEEDPESCSRTVGMCVYLLPDVRANTPRITYTMGGLMVFPNDFFDKTCKLGTSVTGSCGNVDKNSCPETAKIMGLAKLMVKEICTSENIKGLTTLIPCMNKPSVQMALITGATQIGAKFETIGVESTAPSDQKKRCSAVKEFVTQIIKLLKYNCNTRGLKTLDDLSNNMETEMEDDQKMIDFYGAKCYKELNEISILSRRAMDITHKAVRAIKAFRK